MKCKHKLYGGIGIIQFSMELDGVLHYGVRWIEKANCFSYPSHYFWNEAKNIEIL